MRCMSRLSIAPNPKLEACWRAHRVDTDQVTVILSVYKYETHVKHLSAEGPGRRHSREESWENPGWTLWVFQNVVLKHFKTQVRELLKDFFFSFLRSPSLLFKLTSTTFVWHNLSPTPWWCAVQEGPKASRKMTQGGGQTGLFFFEAKTEGHFNPRIVRPLRYTPQNKHGTWKWTLGKGDSYWKPPFPGSMLIFGGVYAFIWSAFVWIQPPPFLNSGTCLECGAGHVASTNGRVLAAGELCVVWATQWKPF